MRRSWWFPLCALPLIMAVVCFAYSIYAHDDQLLGPLRFSMLLALGLNGSIGFTIGVITSWYKWVSTRDSAECVALFGVKAGITLFVVLSLISIVLKLCKQPPTYAAYGMVVVPLHVFEIGSCVLEPVVWIWEACEFCSNTIKTRLERRRCRKRK